MRRLQQGSCHDEAWKTSTRVCVGDLEHRPPIYPHVERSIPLPSLASPHLPKLPIYTFFYSRFFPTLLHPSLSATIGAKCLLRLHLAVVVRISVTVDVVHRPQPVLHLKILYVSKTLQTMERTILPREQMIPLQRYESTYGPTQTRY